MVEGTPQPDPEIVWANSDGDCIVEDLRDGWHIQAWFALIDGAPRITELRIRSAGGASTLNGARGQRGARQHYTHELNRKVPRGGIKHDAPRLHLERLHDAVQRDKAARAMLALRGAGVDADFRKVRRPGRAGRDDYFYAVWAQRYLDMCVTTGRPFKPLAALYPVEARNKKPWDTIKGFIEEAKHRNLIVGRTPGRAGGRLSAKAKRLLEKGEP